MLILSGPSLRKQGTYDENSNGERGDAIKLVGVFFFCLACFSSPLRKRYRA